MSIFQCQKCGCAENTSLTMCSHGQYLLNSYFDDIFNTDKNTLEALRSYKQILGLKTNEPFQSYCSACCPSWFDEKGRYGIGPNPNPTPGNGMWHGRFKRTFLPKGQFETNRFGNLQKKGTDDDNYRKYALEQEEECASKSEK